MKRIIFHVDVNNAFLSWSAVYLLNNGFDIDIHTIPSVIGGDEEKRKGIVLSLNLKRLKRACENLLAEQGTKPRCPP